MVYNLLRDHIEKQYESLVQENLKHNGDIISLGIMIAETESWSLEIKNLAKIINKKKEISKEQDCEENTFADELFFKIINLLKRNVSNYPPELLIICSTLCGIKIHPYHNTYTSHDLLYCVKHISSKLIKKYNEDLRLESLKYPWDLCIRIPYVKKKICAVEINEICNIRDKLMKFICAHSIKNVNYNDDKYLTEFNMYKGKNLKELIELITNTNTFPDPHPELEHLRKIYKNNYNTKKDFKTDYENVIIIIGNIVGHIDFWYHDWMKSVINNLKKYFLLYECVYINKKNLALHPMTSMYLLLFVAQINENNDNNFNIFTNKNEDRFLDTLLKQIYYHEPTGLKYILYTGTPMSTNMLNKIDKNEFKCLMNVFDKWIKRISLIHIKFKQCKIYIDNDVDNFTFDTQIINKCNSYLHDSNTSTSYPYFSNDDIFNVILLMYMRKFLYKQF